MTAITLPFPVAAPAAESARARAKAGARLLFQRCDGKAAGEALDLPRTRRRLSAIVKQHADRSRPHIVCVYRRGQPWAPSDFSVRMRKQWRHTRIGPHDTIAIIYAPLGGGAGQAGRGGGKQTGAAIGLVVASLALMALGQFWAIGALGSALNISAATAGTIWAAGSAALLAGGAYLLSKATQAKANKEAENRPVYGVSGGGNQPRSGDRIPVVYGRCWNSPDLSQPDYTVYDGDDQVLYKRLTIGCGKYAIKAIRVGGITMWTADGGMTPPFAGASIEVIQPGAVSGLVPGAVATVQAVSGNELPRAADFPNWAGPFDFGVEAPDQSRIQLDYSLPQGIYAVPQSGKFQGQQFAAAWGVHFQYAPCDEDGTITGSWSDLYSEAGETLTTQAQRFTKLIDIPAGPGRYAFRARNTGSPEEIEHSSGEFTADVTNDVVWEGLRSHIPEIITRPGITELALVVRSGKSLGVTSYGEVEVESSRILPVWFGSSSGWIDQETDKCVWAAADVLRDQLHGAGIPDSAIDLDRLLHYSGTLAQYDTFSGVIRGPVSVYEALSTVLGTMRASPLRLGNVWTVVRDEAKSVRKHVISRRQIIRDSSAQTFTLDLSDGSADVIVEWFADGDPKRRREKRVTFGTQTMTPRRMAAMGATDAAHAIHLATWAAATAYYRRERRSVTTELAGRLLMPNDSAMIDVWYFDAVQTAGITGRDGLLLDIDSEVTLAPSSYAVLRARDGKEWGPVGVTMEGARLALNALDVAQAQLLSGITLENVLNTQTQAFTSIVIGTLAEAQDAWLIRTIRFSGENRVDVEAVFDAPQVWSALNETIVPPPPPPSSGLENDGSLLIPYIRANAVQRNGAMFMDWTCGRVRQAAEYVVLISYDDWATSETAHRGAASSGSYPLRETTGTIWVRAYAVSATGNKSLVVSTQFSVRPAFLNLDNAIHGSLKIEAFTDGIEPVGLVDGLPDPFEYAGPTIVLDINDQKLYRIEGGVWVAVVNTADLEGTITETQIADDAISTPKLKANSVTTPILAAGAVTANELAADSVIAGKIQTGAVSADKINVTKLDAISADLGAISAGSLNINSRFIVDASGTVTISNASTGARLVITSSLLMVYDASNVLRVRLGIW